MVTEVSNHKNGDQSVAFFKTKLLHGAHENALGHPNKCAGA
jgi:hypothetical protein